MQNAFLDRQQKALVELAELVARRAAGEQDIDRRHAARAQEIVDRHKALREQLKETYPSAVVHTFSGAGHFPYLKFAGEYAQFLRVFFTR